MAKKTRVLSEDRPGYFTAMAGEFFVLEKLYRLGHIGTLTFGNAKSIDIIAKTGSGKLREISVKAIRGGGKWGVDRERAAAKSALLYVLLHYRDFGDPASSPEVFVIPALDAQSLKRRWFGGKAIYCSNAKHRARLEPFRDRWDLIDK
jgi:hypothetical protein